MTGPAAPTNLVATAGNASVTLSWSASAGATSYTVKNGTTTLNQSPIAAYGSPLGTVPANPPNLGNYPLVTTSGACGFVPKAELSGERVQELLSP